MAVLLFAPIVAKVLVEAGGATLGFPRGIAQVLKTDIGEYLITLATAIPLADFIAPTLSLEGAVPGTITYTRINDTSLIVNTAEEALGALTLTDRKFGFLLMRNEG